MGDLADIRAAYERIHAHILRTPLQGSQTLSRMAGAKIHLKCENLQKTGSFKARGALNRILQLEQSERRRGVVAASAGNHAQGVAYAGAIAGVNVTVVMPVSAAIAKIEATRGYGAEVVLAGEDYAAAFRHAAKLARRRCATLVPAFDDDRVIAGQGTVGVEILEDLPEVEIVVVPVGGGGLAAGIAAAIAPIAPRVQVIGAQAELASTLIPSLRARRRIAATPAPTIADGLATSSLGARPWRILRRRLWRAVTVGEAEIAAAILLLLERAKLVVEGAGATALAACLGPLLNLGLAKQGRVFRFATVLDDRPGALSRLTAVVGEAGANIKTIHHDRGRVDVGVLETLVTAEIETRGRGHVPEIVRRLRAAGYRPIADA
jgi:threonine dehydratase